MASISLPIYDWDSQDAYHPFSIFHCTLENWLLLNCIPLDSKDHLRYIFRPWEPNPWKCMHNGCLPAVKRNRKWPRWKLLPSLTESNREWHTMSTPMCVLENLKILWPGWERNSKISLHASRHWWTTARWSIMSIASINCIVISSVHTAMRESSLGNLWPSHSRHHPMSWLTLLWTTLPSNMPGNKSPHSSKTVDAICQDKWQVAHTSHNSNGHTPSAPSKDCPNCTWQHPAGRANYPAHDSHCSKCDKMGHWGPKCHGCKPL